MQLAKVQDNEWKKSQEYRHPEYVTRQINSSILEFLFFIVWVLHHLENINMFLVW